MRTLLVIVGVRPQYVKAAALISELAKKAPDVPAMVIDIRQHYDDFLNRSIVEDVGLSVDLFSQVEPGRGALHYISRGLEAIEAVNLKIDRKDLSLAVFGDANPALVGMIAARKLDCPLVHIEAGARRDPREQEHWNSLLVDTAADLRLAVTDRHMLELQNERLSNGSYLTGDLAFDWYRGRGLAPRRRSSGSGREGVVITLHRPENMTQQVIDQCLDGCFQARQPVTFVCHPRSADFVRRSKWSTRISILEPLPPTQILALVRRSTAVLTDSGGLAREAHYLRTPVLMRRDVGGWPELRAYGVLQPVSASASSVCEGVDWARAVSRNYPSGSPLVVPGGIELGIEEIRKVCKQ
jgi:UDP-N-acetylglucosamine 2-epimerase